jgi:hypothetical protein
MHADSANLSGGTPLNQFRITGLGMGGSGPNFARSNGTGLDARPEPGGITIQQVEDLEIDLGPGNDHFTVINTPAGTKTSIDAGDGNDLVDVKSISDHTFVNLGAGADTINVSNDAHTLAGLTGLLTVSGDVPRATVVALAKGSPAQGSLIAPVNAIQQVTVDATGGTFTLSLTNPATQVTATTGNVVYGGLGDDFVHAGAGDGAVSGGEAQAAWYNDLPVGAAVYAHGAFAVADPVNPLGYDPTTRKLATYDANNPLALIPNFYLNFDATDGLGAKIDDGKDRLFGDDGNDWIVGGTDNNRLFSDKGDNLMNADNNLTTNGGLNNLPDAVQFADRDFAYGGDGLDVMIANTGADRMYDWGGEFNTYLVPFAPFGDPTVVRAPSPQIQQFLLGLGHWSGADQSMTEPNGELGLFTHSDPQWHANHGGPRDPQAGNIGGTHRDTPGAPEEDRGTAMPLVNTPAGPAGASSTVAGNSTNVLLNQVFVAPDPSNPAQNVLFVGGTNSDDLIVVKLGTTSAYLDVAVPRDSTGSGRSGWTSPISAGAR